MAKKKMQDLFNPDEIFTEAVKEIKKESINKHGKTVDVLTFARSFLNVSLFPSQIVILKFLYANSRFNRELEITDDDIAEIKSWSIDQHWVFNGDNNKLDVIRDKNNSCMDLVLVLGRRSGKSFITSLISVYEAYKLLELGDPVRFYGVEADIRIINTATNKDQAQDVIFKQIKRFIKRCPYFYGRIGKETEDEIHLLTDKDIEQNKEIARTGGREMTGSVILQAGSSNSKGLRGHTAAMVVYDEMAHFFNTDGKSSSKEVYNALSRSVFDLRAKGDGRNVVISSPDIKSGFFYNHYETAKKLKSMQVFQIPTKDANPRIQEEALRDEYLKDPETFTSEFGAQFRASSGNAFFPYDKIQKAFTKRDDLVRSKRAFRGYDYYMHIDAASSSDNWAVLIAHPVQRFNQSLHAMETVIIEDYSEFWTPKLGEYLDEDEIMDETILPLIKLFKPVSVTYDHMFSIPQRMKLTRTRTPHSLISFAGRQKNEIYSTLRDFIIQERIELCRDDAMLEGELKAIIVDYTRVPPKISKDQNNQDFPNDDLADCLGGVVYSISLGPTGRVRLPRSTVVHTGRR